MTPKSVKKKLKTPAFAAAVNRDEVRAGAEELGVDFDEHIVTYRVIAGRSEGRADELELQGKSAERTCRMSRASATRVPRGGGALLRAEIPRAAADGIRGRRIRFPREHTGCSRRAARGSGFEPLGSTSPLPGRLGSYQPWRRVTIDPIGRPRRGDGRPGRLRAG